jgi:hypothetical protein
MSSPWWYCPPKSPPEECPTRPVGFVPFSEYDADFKYPLGSSRSPNKITSDCCYGPGIVLVEDCASNPPDGGGGEEGGGDG